jgi:hypothetical protein
MESSENFDLQKQKIAYLEKEVIKLQDDLSLVVASVREVQKYLIRLAHNQAVVSEQVAAWPYVKIPVPEKPKKSARKNDNDKEK